MAQWVQTISDVIDKAFSFIRPKLIAIPPLIMICAVAQRPGMSAINIVANIIRRQPEAGAYTGVMPDGSPNIMERMYVIIVEEILKEMRLNGRVDISVSPGAITSFGTGANAGGAVSVFSTNTNPVTAYGIFR